MTALLQSGALIAVIVLLIAAEIVVLYRRHHTRPLARQSVLFTEPVGRLISHVRYSARYLGRTVNSLVRLPHNGGALSPL